MLLNTPVQSRPFCCRTPLPTPFAGRTARQPMQPAAASSGDALEQLRNLRTGVSGALSSVEAGMKRQTVAGAAGAMGVMAAAVEETDKSLRELNKDDYHSFLEAAGERLVVVDFYTDWCGPCKVILPHLEDLAQELKGKVDIVKVNCNAQNKELGKNLNIRVAPTFHLYRNSNKVAEMTGAKIEELKALIDKNI